MHTSKQRSNEATDNGISSAKHSRNETQIPILECSHRQFYLSQSTVPSNLHHF